MARLQIEISDPKFTPENVTLLTINSSHIHGRSDVNVYCETTDSSDLPIVLLLHGVYGSNWAWMAMGGVHKVYQSLRQQGLGEFILVMPSDGGLWQGSAYLPLIKQGNYEQWIVDDVLATVKQYIKPASDHSKVFISGLSMGGYGALRLGAKFPNLFSGISAHSSVTDLTDLQTFIDNPVTDYQTEFRHESDLHYWFSLNKALLPPLRFDCGRSDPLFASNNTFSQRLTELGVSHHYEVFDGGHEWPYWHEHVAKTLTFFDGLR